MMIAALLAGHKEAPSCRHPVQHNNKALKTAPYCSEILKRLGIISAIGVTVTAIPQLRDFELHFVVRSP
jgi:hypothetical protein